MSELPELTELTGLQAKFVLMITSDPACIGKPKEAAIAAGYSTETAHVQCYQLLRKPHIKAAIAKANLDNISGPLAIQAVAFLERILNDEQAPKGIRLDAAKTILDRAGIVAARTPDASLKEIEKDLANMTSGELAGLADQAKAARETLEQRLKDITPQAAQLEGRAVAVDGRAGDA